MYRGSTFFTKGCRYASERASDFQSFANLEDGTPCEHIIFHDCLRHSQHAETTKIAIQPSLNTWWDKPVHIGSYLRPGGKISTGLVQQDGLVRSSRRPADEALRLENGDYYLQISDRGGLIIHHQDSGEPIWELEVDFQEAGVADNWDFAFLTLAKDGELTLAHQFNHESCVDCFQNGSNHGPFHYSCRHWQMLLQWCSPLPP